MRQGKPVFRGAKVAAVVLAVLLGVCVAAGQEPAEPGAMLKQARGLIGEGKAAEAKAALEKIVRDFAKKPEAEEAAKLIDRISSIQILIDYSHDAEGSTIWLADRLAEEGYEVTRSYAYLPSLCNTLSDYELIVLLQKRTTLGYHGLEYAVLYDYVKAGGRLLLISMPRAWAEAHPGRSPRACPIRRLARRFGVKGKGELQEQAIGKGKVFHYGDVNLLTDARLNAKEPETRRGLVNFFEQRLPYPKLTSATRLGCELPEIVVREGRVSFHYPQPLRKPAAWVKKALPKMLQLYADLFDAPLANDVVAFGVASEHETFCPGDPFDLSLLQPKDKLLHELGMHLYQAHLQPPGGAVDFPTWMQVFWADAATTHILVKLGAGQRYQRYEQHHIAALRAVDPTGKRIDIAIAVMPGPHPQAYWGKCKHVFRDLSKKHGGELPRKLREIVFLYHQAGRLPRHLSTAQTIRLLSLAVGKDLFPYFRSLGTHVEPLPIDFAEPDRLRKEIAEKKAREDPEKKEEKDEKEGNRTP